MDIEKILEYQSLDMIINKAEQAFANSEENKKYNALRARSKSYQEQLLKLENETGELYGEIEAKEKAMADLSKEIKEGTRSMSPKNLDQAAKCDDSLNQLEAKLAAIEKEITHLFKRLSDIAKEAHQCMAALSKVNAEVKAAKAALAEKRNEILKGISEEGVKRNELKAVISKEDMALYEQKRNDGIRLPYVVEFKDGNCRGCGMHVQTEMQGKLLQSGDIAECPNCRRILYRK